MTDIIGCHPNLQWNRIQFQGNDSLGGTQRYSTSMMRKGHLVLQMARHGYRVSIPAFKFTLYTMETHLLQLHDTVCGLETLFMSNLKEKLSYEIQKHSKNTAHLKSQVTLTHLIGTSLTHLFFFFHLGPPGPPHPKDHPSVAEVEQVEQVLLQRSKLKDLPAKFAA